jgi:GTP-binding protein
MLRRFFCSLPSVAIVGRSNVGKSTLFNRIQSTQRNKDNLKERAIVYNQAGTTREGKSVACDFGRLRIRLSDTGGIEDDGITEVSPLLTKMREKSLEIIKNSNVVVVVIDAKSGVTPIDMTVAKLVRETNVPTVLVANKCEGQSFPGEYAADAYEMDLGDPVLISAQSGEGIDDFYERLVLEVEDTLDREQEGEREELSRADARKILRSSDPADAKAKSEILNSRQESLLFKPVQIGLIGRPNAGKSSLLNALVREDRAIVDDHPGTTTDAIAVNWNYHKHQLRIVDTAGIMKGWKHGSGDAQFKDPGAETIKTMNTSHVCVLVIDAFESYKGNTMKFPSRNEVKLGHEVIDAGKCLVVAVNKWDLIPEKHRAQFRRGLSKCVANAFYDIKGLPIVFVSAATGLNLDTLLVNCVAHYRKWNIKLQSSKLNSWLEAFVAHNPPPWKDGQKQYPKFITQTRTRPPTFSLYTNTFATFPDNYLRQMKELLKEEFGLRGIPLRINLRSSLMPKPGKPLRDRDVARWKRLGPKQAAAVDKIRASKKRVHDDNELD